MQPLRLKMLLTSCSIGSFYAFILNRSDRVRLTVVARSNYNAVVTNVCYNFVCSGPRY
jgi:hypothetical protein